MLDVATFYMQATPEGRGAIAAVANENEKKTQGDSKAKPEPKEEGSPFSCSIS